MNRATTRASYTAWLRRERDMYGRREEHGLPHHPDGSGFADCPECHGTGMWFHPRGPSGEFDEPCNKCGGSGVILDGHRDPLTIMHATRKWRFMPMCGPDYSFARTHSARHPLGMVQLRMVEAAIGGDLMARGAVQAWRMVA